jgi:hypothetical protein
MVRVVLYEREPKICMWPSLQLKVRQFCFKAAQVNGTHAATSRVDNQAQDRPNS